MAKDRKTDRSDRTHRKHEQNEHPPVDWAFVEACLAAIALRMIFLWGPPGVGKTYAGYKKGRIDAGVYSITLTDETPAAELRGMWMPEKDGYVWRDGPVVRAMREGARVVVNEIGQASPDVLSFLLACCESRDSARITLPTGEHVMPAEGFNLVATSNEPPSHLPAALRDRFDCTIEIGAPHPEALALLSEPLRNAALQTFDLSADRAISLRAWLKLEELQKEMDPFVACRAVFGEDRGRKVYEALTMRQLSF
jgi:MoxR-like ATPase